MYESSSDSSFKEALADALEVGKREIAELASVVDGAAAMYGEAGAKLVRDGDLDAVMGEFAQMRLRFADELSALSLIHI